MSIDALSPTQRPLDSQGILPEVTGIFSGDILIRHALIIGLQDLRDNPWQLDLVFASLLNDPYTVDIYGQKELDKAKQWFLKTNIPVILDATLTNSPAMPCVIVSLQESNEAEATIGDVHYVTEQSTPAEWEPIGQKFSAQYFPTSGLVVPNRTVIVNDKMVFVDGSGNRYKVLDIQVDVDGKENFLIQKGLTGNFSNCVLEWSTNKISANLESLNFKEIYNIVCNVKGEPYYALYLYMIVKYCLLRYKKSLLEGRGFERTTINCSKLMPNNSLSPTGAENIWCRVITITGFVKEIWASVTSEKITQVSYAPPTNTDGLKVSQIDFLPASFRTDPSQEDPSYMVGDGISVLGS